jgi:ATP-dependent Clp protease protease subunit
MFRLLFVILYAGTIFQTTNADLIEFKKDNFVSLREVISQDSSSKLLLKLNAIESKHDKLYIYINSPGGNVMAGLEIVNYIKSLQERSKKIICIAHNAMSMAFVVFQYCSERYILHSSTLMQHQMSLGLQGKLYDINSRMTYLNSLETKLNQYQSKRLNMSEEKFIQKIQHDWWLYADDIIAHNAADKMVSIFCSFDNYDETVSVSTVFGEVQIKYSACPLINYPLHITFPSMNFSEDKKSEFMDTHVNFMKKYI